MTDDDGDGAECRWCRAYLDDKGEGRHWQNCAVNVVKDIIQERDECKALRSLVPPASPPTPRGGER